MYYRKNRSILRSIKNNNNNKAYFALTVLMLAAICIIAACIILNTKHRNIQEYPGETGTDVADMVSSSDLENTIDSDKNELNETIPEQLKYAICLVTDENLLVIYRKDQEDNCVDIPLAAYCTIGEDVINYLNGKNQVVLSDLYVVPSKSLWKNINYNDTTYFVQYYSMMNGIEFHSAMYTINGDNVSILPDSYNAIINRELDFIPASGVTLTVATSKWVFENIPGTTDICICRSYKYSPLDSAFIEGDFKDNIESIINNSPDGKYTVSGRLIPIPYGFYAEPTDDNVKDIYSPYTLGSISNVSNKTVEFGQIAYSFIEKGSTLPGIIFNDVILLSEDGKDISNYLVCTADVSMYVNNQIAAMNVNGFLLPGDYTVRFLAADRYGNILEDKCWFSVIDTTAPVISLSRNITEINRAQMSDPEYIRNMVTVTELCKLISDEVDYILTEEGDIVKIHFTSSDVYGNVGELDVELKRVD